MRRKRGRGNEGEGGDSDNEKKQMSSVSSDRNTRCVCPTITLTHLDCPPCLDMCVTDMNVHFVSICGSTTPPAQTPFLGEAITARSHGMHKGHNGHITTVNTHKQSENISIYLPHTMRPQSHRATIHEMGKMSFWKSFLSQMVLQYL